MSKDNPDQLRRLKHLNHQLIALLESRGIDWRSELDHAAKSQPFQTATSNLQTSTPDAASAATPAATPAPTLTAEQKIALFRSLFRGRTDVYPIRWENNAGRSGYSPTCHNEWKPNVCGKPSIKCSQCPNQAWKAVTDQVIYDHLAGKHVIGIYPMIGDDQCHFLAVDFDEGNWQADANAFRQSCEELGIPCAIEISRSGNGAHAWIFFSEPVSAKQARNLGAAIISYTCAGNGPNNRQLKLSSYDRMFPNQDTLPKVSWLGAEAGAVAGAGLAAATVAGTGNKSATSFGNLIALPLQKHPRSRGNSVFVDHDFAPYPDQWAYLASIKPLSVPIHSTQCAKDTSGASNRLIDHASQAMATTLSDHIDKLIQQAVGSKNALDVGHYTLEAFDADAPWQRQPVLDTAGSVTSLTNSANATTITLTLSNLIYLPKAELSAQLTNRLIRIAAFQNPEYYKAQALRLSVWNKPRIIACAENFPNHIGLPRGCLDAVIGLLAEHNIQANIQDERQSGRPLFATVESRTLETSDQTGKRRTRAHKTKATQTSPAANASIAAVPTGGSAAAPAIKFHGQLRPEQTKAVAAMLAHDHGVLCAPTAFGKTVTAAALIAKRGVNTLILVHRTELLDQWKERLCGFLGLEANEIGIIGGGKKATANEGKKGKAIKTGKAKKGNGKTVQSAAASQAATRSVPVADHGVGNGAVESVDAAEVAEVVESFGVTGTVDGIRPFPSSGQSDFLPQTRIDIAMVQSLVRQGNVNPIVEHYGHVIIDECHHVSAVSFEQILKAVKAKYVLGLTATPIRRDGLQPIIMMQCGPIRHRASRAETTPTSLTVHAHEIDEPQCMGVGAENIYAPTDHSSRTDRTNQPIQAVFQALAQDEARTEVIVNHAMIQFDQGRKVLLLTERTDHLLSMQQMIQASVEARVRTKFSPNIKTPPQDELTQGLGKPVEPECFFVLHGRLKKSERTATLQRLQSWPPDHPLILLATGKLIGEGFDHAPLDTLVLAMPISWKGTLQQYVGRLHREHANKTNILVIDFIDQSRPSLARMWQKRQAGYKAMGYGVERINHRLSHGLTNLL